MGRKSFQIACSILLAFCLVRSSSVVRVSSEVQLQEKPQQKRVSFIRPAIQTLPQQVRNWLENCLKLDMTRFAHSIELNGKQYLFAAAGKINSGNHSVEISDITTMQDEIVVQVKFTRLPPKKKKGQRHYDLVSIKALDLNIRFKPIGDDDYISITRLVGIDRIPNIVAQSRAIKVFTPKPGEVIDQKFTVTGVARVFEANVLYRVFNKHGNRLLVGSVTAASALDWGYFSIDLTLPPLLAQSALLTLELYGEDAKEGREKDTVTIPLKVESI